MKTSLSGRRSGKAYDSCKGIVIFGFPAIGKSTLCKKNEYKHKVIDLASSNYAWILTDEEKKRSFEQRKGFGTIPNPDYPENYFGAIKDAIKKFDFVFIAISDFLYNCIEFCRKENLEYWLIFPTLDCKQEYLERMRQRGNSQDFLDTVDKNFEQMIQRSIDDPKASKKIILKSGEYLEMVFADYLG